MSAVTPSPRINLKDVFPDIHQKLCKKIAQLTKVIYHLNTQNEDHVFEMKVLASKHDDEIKKILDETAVKLESFKSTVADRRAQIDYEVKLKRLEDVHKKEKETAIADFQYFREQTKFKEDTLIQEFNAKQAALKKDIQNMSDAFEAKLKQLDQVNKDIANKHTADISKLKLEYDTKLSGNENSNQDNIDKMTKQNAQLLRDEQEKWKQQFELEKSEIMEAAKLNLASELMRVNQKGNADKADSLKALQDDYDSRLEAVRTESKNRIESISQTLQNLQIQHTALKEEKDRVTAELNVRIESLQKALGQKVGDLDQQVAGFTTEIQSLKEEKDRTMAQATERSEEIQRLQKLIAMKNITMSELDDKLKQNEAEINRLRTELTRSNSDGSDKENSYRNQVLSLTNELNGMASTANSLREDLKSEIKSGQKMQQDFQNKFEIMTKERDAGLDRIRILEQQQQQDKESYSKELKELNGTLIKTQNDNTKALNELANNHKQLVIELKTKHEETVTKLLNETQQQGDATFQKVKQDHFDAINTLKQNHSDELDALTAKNILQIKELSSQQEKVKQDWMTSYEKLKSDEAFNRFQLQQEVDRIKEELNQSLAEKMKLIEKHKTDILSMEKTIENLKLSHEAEIAKLTLKNRDELETKEIQLKTEMKQELDKLTEEFNLKHSNEIQILNIKHDAELDKLRQTMQNELDLRGQQVANQSSSQQQLLTQIEALNKEKLDFIEAHKSELLKLAAVNEDTLNQLKRAHETLLAEKLAESDKKRLIELDQYKAAFNQSTIELKDQHTKASLQLTTESKEALHSALQSLTERLNTEKTEALTSLELNHKADLANKKTEFDQKLLEESAAHSRTKSTMEYKDSLLQDMEKSLKEEREVRHNKESQFVLDKDKLIRDHEHMISQERLQATKHMEETRALHATELQEKSNEYELLRRELTNMKTEYEDKLMMMEIRWNTRASRSEDVEMIQRLRYEIVEREQLLERLKEELGFVKRELINREEVYNKKFNSSPNVGVMNVLKPPQQQVPGKDKMQLKNKIATSSSATALPSMSMTQRSVESTNKFGALGNSDNNSLAPQSTRNN